jgi:hypothetical protein
VRVGLSAKVQRQPMLHTLLHSGQALAPPLKSENSRFPTDGKKAVICYSVGDTRRPAYPKYKEEQHFSMYLPTGESFLPCLLVGIPDHAMSGHPLLCWCQGPCLSRWTLPTEPHIERAPNSPLKSQHTRFSNKGLKAVTCYSSGHTRRPTSSNCTETQHLSPHLPAGES